MTQRVLLFNVTRLGDLVLTLPLLARLRHEWPGVVVDMVVQPFMVPVAALFPGVRNVYSFSACGDSNLVYGERRETLPASVEAWAVPLLHTQYDRIINASICPLNWLVDLVIDRLECGDVRRVGPELELFVSPAVRPFNHTRYADLVADVGSGPGPFAPLSLPVPHDAAQWARGVLHCHGDKVRWVAVHMGASSEKKAWRPSSFGRTMALLSQRVPVGFVLTGSTSEGGDKGTVNEAATVQEAVAAYHAAGGTGPLCDMVGGTDVAQLLAVLDQCDLMLTNDTGPMHLP